MRNLGFVAAAFALVLLVGCAGQQEKPVSASQRKKDVKYEQKQADQAQKELQKE